MYVTIYCCKQFKHGTAKNWMIPELIGIFFSGNCLKDELIPPRWTKPYFSSSSHALLLWLLLRSTIPNQAMHTVVTSPEPDSMPPTLPRAHRHWDRLDSLTTVSWFFYTYICTSLGMSWMIYVFVPVQERSGKFYFFHFNFDFTSSKS